MPNKVGHMDMSESQFPPPPPAIKLAMNGHVRRRSRNGAVKVDLSCADKTIRRPESAPDLAR